VWAGTTFATVPTHRLNVRPGFEWPQSEQATYLANRLPKGKITAFLAAALGWPTDDMPSEVAQSFAVRKLCGFPLAGWRSYV